MDSEIKKSFDMVSEDFTMLKEKIKGLKMFVIGSCLLTGFVTAVVVVWKLTP